ncbi:uncharacterized protein PHACADRAFT_200730 [Phanerochaete carnosa HHB-10118-sp]|uniref:Uncharacterized protein n=1 Tax=Phanerochaete carnosa (strain HHB-10118-sp) TaxID=650164 RepID=K5VW54_PHACS|nr:uncharacterized protein PHACADRAFT_200730 [Phanerochaete carnosa HHB-10118-sp]EKM50799.1 hypothetical protein PHACADRAFT_200730 [Phanerochaete carnosa HHB-10118-sp]
MLAFFLILFAASLANSCPTPSGDSAGVPFVNVTTNGGSWLDNAGDGFGEPLNVIISGESSAEVLTQPGLLRWAQSIGFSTECLGIHLGAPQSANLGDGNGFVNQTIELREDYGVAEDGTCLESLIGGNHFRVYVQNGTLAPTGAFFLAVSKEEDAFDDHNIVPDGYNIGRDEMVAGAVGMTTFDGTTFNTTAVNMTNAMPAGSAGVNHGIAVDGAVILLTIMIV